MTRSNRGLNRLLLAVVGLILLATAAAIVAVALTGTGSGSPLDAEELRAGLPDGLPDTVAGWVASTAAGAVALASAVATIVAPAIVAAAAAPVVIAVGGLIVVALAVAWIATRGRGRIAVAHTAGGVAVEAAAIEALLRDELAGNPEVLHASARSSRIRRRDVLVVDVDVRRGPDLPRVVASVRDALLRTDELLGFRPEVLVHVRSSLRVGRGARRVD